MQSEIDDYISATVQLFYKANFISKMHLYNQTWPSGH